MASTLLLAATTSAVASAPVTVRAQSTPATFQAVPALAGAETAPIQFSPDNGTTWVTLVSAGVTQQLSASDTAISIYAPGMYRINKGASAGATAIYVAQLLD